MARNQYAGPCYRCGKTVEPGDGHFERLNGRWRVQHADCAIKHRGTPDPERQAAQLRKWAQDSHLTGRRGQNARRKLREWRAAKQTAKQTAQAAEKPEPAKEG